MEGNQSKSDQGLRVLVFGAEAAVLGTSQIVIGAEHAIRRVGELRQWLTLHCPQLSSVVPELRVAVNHRFATDDCPIGPEDEIALIGKVSGG